MDFIESISYGLPPIEEVKEFEAVNEIVLPDDYKQFLLVYNGGIPQSNKNRSPDTTVSYVLGMHNGPFHSSIYKYISVYSERIPFDTIPIASDPFGNLFLMSLHPENYGNIFFWNHEGELSSSDGNYTANCTYVAKSFTEFITSLI